MFLTFPLVQSSAPPAFTLDTSYNELLGSKKAQFISILQTLAIVTTNAQQLKKFRKRNFPQQALHPTDTTLAHIPSTSGKMGRDKA